jgi:acetylornithine deacetylase/succinyl-diaminopimelate desuccinylase-like protein
VSAPETAVEVLQAIDQEELCDLAVRLCSINSPPGFEAAAADFVQAWLHHEGISVRTIELSSERRSVLGRLKGTGRGTHLLFNSHLDTDRRGPLAWWTAGDAGIEPEVAKVEGEMVIGKAVVNDRGPMACWLIAVAAIKRSRVELKGDLVLTAVCGEIGMAPVDEFQGPGFLGKGIGTRLLIDAGAIADFAVVAESTNWAISEIECGCAYFRILVDGVSIYTPWHEKGHTLSEHPNATIKAAALALEIDKWARHYEARETFEFRGAKVVPKVSVGAMRSGAPYSPSRTAAKAALYVDVRLAPGTDALAIQDELHGLARGLGIEVDIQPYLYRRGYQAKGNDVLRDSAVRACQEILKGGPPAPASGYVSMWRDRNIFSELGIPAISFGPPRSGGRDTKGPYGLYIEKTDMLRAAQIYALLALDICNRDRSLAPGRTN